MRLLGDLLAELSNADDARAEAASKEIAEHGPGAIPELEKLLVSNSGEARWWAARALGEMEQPRAGELLASLLADADPNLRQCAALGLRQHPHPDAIPGLISLLDEEDQLLARLAGDALIAAGKDATKVLLEVLEGGSPQARIEAARALAAIGDLRAVSALFKLLDSGSVMLEHYAEEGLEKMGIGMNFFRTST